MASFINGAFHNALATFGVDLQKIVEHFRMADDLVAVGLLIAGKRRNNHGWTRLLPKSRGAAAGRQG